MTRRPLPRSAAGAIIASLAVIVLAADQFVKHLTVTHLPLRETVPVWGNFFQLYHTTNPGAAFSMGESVTWLFTIALAVVSGVIIWKAFSVRSRLWAIVLGLLLGGVLGNLGDRLFRPPGFPVGHVVDMIYMPWMMSAIFNIADIFIVGGMITVALLVVLGLRLDGTREQPEPKGSQSESPVDESDASEADSADDSAPADTARE